MSKQASRMKSIKSEVICDVIWRRCYDHGFRSNDLVADAFGHPAKLAKGLGFRIVEHAIANGWIKAGDFCVDPFGGVATGALALMFAGVNYVGCELEPKFVGLAQQNLDLWQRKYGSKAGFGTARILQGDSRRLSEIVVGANLICSSPPYARSEQSRDGEFTMQSTAVNPSERRLDTRSYFPAEMDSPGQLGAMKE